MQQVQGDQSSDRSKALFDTKTSTFVQLTEGVFNRIRIQNQSRALQVGKSSVELRWLRGVHHRP